MSYLDTSGLETLWAKIKSWVTSQGYSKTSTSKSEASGGSELSLVTTGEKYDWNHRAGTITGITMNGASKGTSGVVDLGTVITAHQSLSAYATTSAMNTALAKKVNDFQIGLYVGISGNPQAVKFCTVNYGTAGSENGVFIKISMVSGHGNGASYNFLQDAMLSVSYTGAVSVNNYKYFGQAVTYDTARQYGDIFWVVDTTNKIVDFYTLAGQYSTVNSTPYKRLNSSSGGTITQHTTASVYSSGTKYWATNYEVGVSDLATIRSGAAKGATAIQTHQDISGKQDVISDLATIRSNASSGASKVSCTDATVGGFGYTKNAGTITGITMNGSSKGTSGVVNLGTVLTSHQSLSDCAKISSANTYNGEQKFQNASYCPTAVDNASGVGCAYKASRGAVNQEILGQLIIVVDL